MLGAIIGDIVGSRFEFNNTCDFDFELFTSACDYTDDSICTFAVADAILSGKPYQEAMLAWCRRYPHPMGSYGGGFARWIHSANPVPYNSFGNGSAMRVSAVGWLFDTEEEVLEQAKQSAEITHNHPEGIKGAQAAALAIYLCRKGMSKEAMLKQMHAYYPTFTEPRLGANPFIETCQGTLPICFGIIEKATNFEEALRYAIAVGGDSDTIGAIVGGITEAIWGVPAPIKAQALEYLPAEIMDIYTQFLTHMKSNRI
jgi:ADP-ribosylglycohydrolase